MNLQNVHVGFSKKRQTRIRLGCLGEHLFPQLAGATAFDTVQVRVNSAKVPL